jgi:hypothetical protein
LRNLIVGVQLFDLRKGPELKPTRHLLSEIAFKTPTRNMVLNKRWRDGAHFGAA